MTLVRFGKRTSEADNLIISEEHNAGLGSREAMGEYRPHVTMVEAVAGRAGCSACPRFQPVKSRDVA